MGKDVNLCLTCLVCALYRRESCCCMLLFPMAIRMEQPSFQRTLFCSSFDNPHGTTSFQRTLFCSSLHGNPHGTTSFQWTFFAFPKVSVTSSVSLAQHLFYL